ncbi:MAG: hypothetical protein J1E64_02090 [Acetatifactor sp.]|nr:hypothetical protein [Acetatifactor sp.]
MKKVQKRQAEEFARLLGQAHDEVRKAIDKKDIMAAMELLEQCQDGAIQLGTLIEKTEGEGFVTVSLIEEYCELVYQIHEELAQGDAVEGSRAAKRLRQVLIQVENSIRNDIRERLEVVFFPYKASMWDSMESVWRAADADPDCDAYVVPIPYFDRKPDGSFGEKHYEGNDYPRDVPVIWYEDYDLEARRPDVVYIHNPYDQYNFVTTVDPKYYSFELKKYAELLIYIPYYATSGNWGESKGFCSAYQYADYIIVQAEKYRQFFDAQIPKGKILPLGSPKFDRVIHMCANPGEPPEEWKPLMEGRKVYFYNTSIAGMLADTKRFLKKMEYVLQCFRGREDSCLIWRPHPLLESTFTSMRAEYYPVFQKLKSEFIEKKLGIYDDTPDVTQTIAFCDAYIGDSGSSVTSLFGIAGKPLFILKNAISSEPQPGDWRGGMLRAGFQAEDGGERIIGPGSKLYQSVNQDFSYKYICSLSKYAQEHFYKYAFEIDGKVYVCPLHAQDVLVVKKGKIERTIPLKRQIERGQAFAGAVRIGNSLFLLPGRYPSLVKYDTASGRLDYLDGCREIFVQKVREELRSGGNCVWRDYLLLASPIDNQVLILDSKTDKMQLLKLSSKNKGGCMAMVTNEDEVWRLPYEGDVITRWNPETGELQDYSGLPEGFHCNRRPQGFPCATSPFSSAIFDGDNVYLAPAWGNMYIRLDRNTGRMEEWQPPFPVVTEEVNGYYAAKGPKAVFYVWENGQGERKNYCLSLLDGKLYELNLKMGFCKEIEISFDEEELKDQEPGFAEQTEWLQYACMENAFNSLTDFLDGNITGAPFDKERQLLAYGSIAANYDGTCGEKIHRFVREKL